MTLHGATVTLVALVAVGLLAIWWTMYRRRDLLAEVFDTTSDQIVDSLGAVALGGTVIVALALLP